MMAGSFILWCSDPGLACRQVHSEASRQEAAKEKAHDGNIKRHVQQARQHDGDRV